MNVSKLIQSFKMSLKSILGNKGRSALTMLGIIIGVASVILITGIGSGATESVTDTLSSMGTKLITVSMNRGGFGSSTRTVTVEEMQDFLEENPNLIAAMSPSVSGRVTLKHGNENTTTSVNGYDSTYGDIVEQDIMWGRYLSDYDVENRAYTCVVGTYIVMEYFGGVNPVGENIKLNGRNFKIVGVFEEKGDSTETSADNTVTIPYTTAMRFLQSKNVSTFYFSAIDEKSVDTAVTEIKNFVTRELGTDSGFSVSSVAEILDAVNEVTGMLTTMLAGIAAISLIVGGIGIMNIMTVSVSERTREIGIRKAIGARTTDILTQFLVESSVLSAMGGVVGIILGIVAGNMVCKAIGIEFVASVGTIMTSFMFSLFIGVFFGIMPARKAAKLNPIDALRSE